MIDRDDDGINLTATNNTVVADCIVTGNVRGSGVHLAGNCTNTSILRNVFEANDEGIEVESATDAVIAGNRIHGSTYYGLNLTTAANLVVYNNLFRNDENVRTPTGSFSGVWNVAPSPGPNVAGGPSIGGNYWGNPDRDGYSDLMGDWNADGFANGAYILPGEIGIDRFPLVKTGATDAGMTGWIVWPLATRF